MTRAGRRKLVASAVAVTLAGAVLALGVDVSRRSALATGIHRIQHVIMVMQENRSFDNYFGTYPGADGIPMQDGRPTVCVPIRRSIGASGRSTTPTSSTAAARTHGRGCDDRHGTGEDERLHPQRHPRTARVLQGVADRT